MNIFIDHMWIHISWEFYLAHIELIISQLDISLYDRNWKDIRKYLKRRSPGCSGTPWHGARKGRGLRGPELFWHNVSWEKHWRVEVPEQWKTQLHHWSVSWCSPDVMAWTPTSWHRIRREKRSKEEKVTFRPEDVGWIETQAAARGVGWITFILHSSIIIIVAV